MDAGAAPASPSTAAAAALLPDASFAAGGPIIGPGSKKRGRSPDDEKEEEEEEEEEGADVDVDGGDDDVLVKKKHKDKGGSSNNGKASDEDEDADADADTDADVVKRGCGAPGGLAVAMATRRIGNSIDFPLSNLRPHLICSLCRGYFRDPYTVADCLHTFCRSCLILFFRQGMRCCPTW
jgi:hypothetical protein